MCYLGSKKFDDDNPSRRLVLLTDYTVHKAHVYELICAISLPIDQEIDRNQAVVWTEDMKPAYFNYKKSVNAVAVLKKFGIYKETLETATKKINNKETVMIELNIDIP